MQQRTSQTGEQHTQRHAPGPAFASRSSALRCCNPSRRTVPSVPICSDSAGAATTSQVHRRGTNAESRVNQDHNQISSSDKLLHAPVSALPRTIPKTRKVRKSRKSTSPTLLASLLRRPAAQPHRLGWRVHARHPVRTDAGARARLTGRRGAALRALRRRRQARLPCAGSGWSPVGRV